ncbi:MAG: hypothetical protein BroJett018_20950 [Chloroflexota bacterium]|nr:MAG: hypothetical protein BroJett018_20950 [Chloroflexota bacterium]
MSVRQFGAETLVIRDDDYPEETHLVDYAAGAVYGVELALPESDDDRYRVNLVRSSRQDHGVEVEQRLVLAEYVSEMEAEEHRQELSTALYEQGSAAVEAYLSAVQQQPIEYAAGYLVSSYPPDAIFTGESASVSILALHDHGITDAPIARNLSPHEASHLSMTLEAAQTAGGVPLLMETAVHEAQTHEYLKAGQPMFPASPALPTFYLDQQAVLEHDAEIMAAVPAVKGQDTGWGWHEAQFVVLPPSQLEAGYQTALFDVYRDALTGDLAGSYLPLGQYDTAAGAERQRDQLEMAAFDAHDSSAGWVKFAEKQVDDPQWQPMETQHYDLYERLSVREQVADLPADPELDPLLRDALRLGAVIIEIDQEEQAMANTLKAERVNWEVDLNEHVSYLPPYVTAAYRSPANADGIAPVRLHLPDDPAAAMYGFEVSAPNDGGDVTLAAVKTFESDILQKAVTESAVLKTYQAHDYDELVSYLDPRSDALSDARALVYEWGRHDLDHAMGSALHLAQANGFKGDALFEQGPADTFTIPEHVRPLEEIQADRDWERDAEHFGMNGYKVPLPETVVHARSIGRYGADAEVEAGLFYGVVVREAALDDETQPLYVVEGVKAWLERETDETKMETVALGLGADQTKAVHTANQVAQALDVAARLETMEEFAHDFAHRAAHLSEGATTALHLNMRSEGLFQAGPPDPERFEVDWGHDETPVVLSSPTTPNFVPPPLDYSRTVGEVAYDLPLEAGQSYEFRMRPIPELEAQVARYGVDALAVETVKHWQAEDKPQQEVVTLGIHYDRDEAREEVDTYVDLAEREGIQSAMTRAAVLADVQSYPDMVESAESLDLHLNPDVRYGAMFKQGPSDPFLSEREIDHAAHQYLADHPPQHELSLKVVPVYALDEQSLGHSVVALDAQWEHEETSRDLADAQVVTAYEVAQFERQPDADFYAASLTEYFDKRGLATEGSNITPALDFVKNVQGVNGIQTNERWLSPLEMSQAAQQEWSLQHAAEDFHPMPIQSAPEHTATVELEL